MGPVDKTEESKATNVVNVRMTPSVQQAWQDLQARTKLKSTDLLAALMERYKTDEVLSDKPESASKVAEVRKLTDALIAMYTGLIESADATLLATNEAHKKNIESKDRIIQDLQAKLEAANIAAKSSIGLKKRAEKAEADVTRLRDELQVFKPILQKLKQIEEDNSKIPQLKEELTIAKAQLEVYKQLFPNTPQDNNATPPAFSEDRP